MVISTSVRHICFCIFFKTADTVLVPRRLTALVPRARRLGVSGYGNLTLQSPVNSPPPPVKTEKKRKHCEGTYNRRPHARVEEPI